MKENNKIVVDERYFIDMACLKCKDSFPKDKKGKDCIYFKSDCLKKSFLKRKGYVFVKSKTDMENLVEYMLKMLSKDIKSYDLIDLINLANKALDEVK